MYLHLGENVIVNLKDVIGIFDIDTSTVKKVTRDYLSNKEKNKQVVYVNYELPKSFIVTSEKVYICSLNTSTLLKRTK